MRDHHTAEVDEPSDLPNTAGAYVLAVDLHRPLPLALAGRVPVTLVPGRYLYAGSARGPGGIRARVGRHVKSGKSVRWHIDRLTNSAGVALIVAVPGGDECALLATALTLAGAEVPVPGFGASDCSECPAHLVKVDAAVDLSVLAQPSVDAVIWRRPPVICSGPPRPTPP